MMYSYLYNIQQQLMLISFVIVNVAYIIILTMLL